MKLLNGDDLGGPFDLIAGLPLHPRSRSRNLASLYTYRYEIT